MKIVARDIARMHPVGLRGTSDFYYARVANDLLRTLKFTQVGMEDGNSEIVFYMALKLALFLEDVVSDAGVWRTFTELHCRMYGRPLPFREVPAGFSPLEIDRESVRVVLWMFMMYEHDNRLVNPDNPGIEEMADAVMPVLRKFSKTAPVNEDLLDFLYGEETFGDLMKVKFVLMWLMQDCYLSEWYLTDNSVFDLSDQLEKVFESASDSMIGYAAKSISAFKLTATPLALLPQQWYAEMLRLYNAEELEEVAGKMESIEFKDFGFYRIEGHDERYVTVTDVEGQTMRVLRSSFNEVKESTLENSKLLVSSFARWNGEWETVGMSTWMETAAPYNALLEEKKKAKDKTFILPPEVLARLEGRRLFFFKDYAALDAWLKGLLGVENNITALEDIGKMQDNLVFVEDSGALSISPSGALGVKHPDNPFYDPARADDCTLRLLFDTEGTTPGLSRHLVAHGLLPDASMNSLVSPERGLQLVQENMDFLARFVRRNNY